MNLFHRISGNHPKHLYILHGLLGMSDNWHLLAKKYSDFFTVVTPDLRNHGQSPHSNDFSYDLIKSDVLELCNLLGSENIYIIGHSMGGKLAMKLALEEPILIDKLIVADMRPHEFLPGHDKIFKALFSLDLQSINSRAEAEFNLASFGIDNKGEILFLLKNLGRDLEGKFIWKPNLAALWKNYFEILKPIHGDPFYNPTLFIHGGMSRYLLPEHHQLILQLFPNVQLATIPHAGHWLHAEAPEEFFNKTMLFLNS